MRYYDEHFFISLFVTLALFVGAIFLGKALVEVHEMTQEIKIERGITEHPDK